MAARAQPEATIRATTTPSRTSPTCLLEGGERLELGPYAIDVRFVPGHSPGSLAFAIDGALYAGDVLFRGSVGRTDLREGDWPTLQASIAALLDEFPPETPVLSGPRRADDARRRARHQPVSRGAAPVSEPVRAPVAHARLAAAARRAAPARRSTTAVRVFERAGFGQVVTPTFEDTALFARTSGDASDVVTQGDVLVHATAATAS